MPIDWSHDYVFDGWEGYRDPNTEKGYILGAEDGVLQVALTENGSIESANGNIVMDRAGIRLHDLTNASIITPIFGTGIIQNTIRNNEEFGLWIPTGSPSVVSNTTPSPNGLSQTADTITFGDGDSVSIRSQVNLAAGNKAIFLVYLKAVGGDGEIQLLAGSSPGSGSIGSNNVKILAGAWRRVALVFTNGTGGAIKPYVSIKRNGAAQLESIYAWGAQVTYGVDREVPYHKGSSYYEVASYGATLGGPLHMWHENKLSTIIGNDWDVLPTGLYNVVLGYKAGSKSDGNGLTAIGCLAGENSDGNYSIVIGYGASSNKDYSIAIGEYAQATSHNQLVIGGVLNGIKTAYIGNGVTNSAPQGFLLSATSGSGTDIAGADMTLAGGQSTGTGAGGNVHVAISPSGSSGSSWNDRQTVATFSANGMSGVQMTPDTTTASFEIPSGYTCHYPNIEIATGHNVTVSGALIL